jgi:arsenate reductase
MTTGLHGLTALQASRPLKLLFLCTHNRCRSILAEAVGNHIGGGLLKVASAGSEPAGAVHPMTLWYLQEHGIPTDGLRAKALDALGDFTPDIVITVCDQAAREACPLWLGKTPKVHWGLSDPSALVGDEAVTRKAFGDTILLLRSRLGWLRQALEQGLTHESLMLLVRTLAHTAPADTTKAA